MRIEHVAIWVHDLERARSFYETYFGAQANDKYVNPRGFSSYFLSFATGARLEIMHDNRQTAHSAERPPVGWAHIAIALGTAAAVDGLTARLAADGYRVLSGPRTTGDGYYESVVLDAEGNHIELTV